MLTALLDCYSHDFSLRTNMHCLDDFTRNGQCKSPVVVCHLSREYLFTMTTTSFYYTHISAANHFLKPSSFVEYKFNVICIPCNILVTQYSIQQNAQSIINNDMSLKFLRHTAKLVTWQNLQLLWRPLLHRTACGSDTVQSSDENFAIDTKGNILTYLLHGAESFLRS